MFVMWPIFVTAKIRKSFLPENILPDWQAASISNRRGTRGKRMQWCTDPAMDCTIEHEDVRSVCRCNRTSPTQRRVGMQSSTTLGKLQPFAPTRRCRSCGNDFTPGTKTSNVVSLLRYNGRRNCVSPDPVVNSIGSFNRLST